ncbi:MAG: LLM class flavin-dependent oxidoreductase [Candidatus Binatia bacterium]
MHFGIVYSIESGGGDRADRVFREAVEEIVLGESVGLDIALISEHHFTHNDFFPSPLIALSYIAARTSKIRLSPGVLLLPLYDPIHVAEDAAVLDIISGGRMVLGVGQGYRPEEFKAFGSSLADRPGRTREGITLIRQLWTQPRVTFHGKHFVAEDIPLRPQPVQKPAPPIWVAAKKKHAVEMAAEVGDGWFADPITPLPIIVKHRANWEAASRRAGIDPATRTMAYYREFFIAPDDARAWELGREATMEGYRNYLQWGHLVDDEGVPIPPHREDLLEGLVRQRFTVGGPERARVDVEMIRNTLNPTHLIMKAKFPGIPHADVMTSIRLVGEKVMPAFAD